MSQLKPCTRSSRMWKALASCMRSWMLSHQGKAGRNFAGGVLINRIRHIPLSIWGSPRLGGRAGIKLPRHIVATADPEEALHDATYIIHAVPVQYTRKFLENVSLSLSAFDSRFSFRARATVPAPVQYTRHQTIYWKVWSFSARFLDSRLSQEDSSRGSCREM